MSPIGEFIAKRRTQLRLTQQEVIDALHLHGIERSTATLSNWEAGRQPVAIELLPAIAAVLDISLLDLYEVAGLLKDLPGVEILKLVNRMSDADRQRIFRMIQAYDSQNNN